MANVLATTTWVVNESAQAFTNSVKFLANIDRQYDDQFATHDGAKVGNTVYARLPNLFTVRDGQAWAPQNITERTAPITLRYQSGVDLNWSSIQQTTELDRIRERYVNPATAVLASTVDARSMADVYKSVWNNVGTPGTTPSANLTYLQAISKIFDQAGEMDPLVAVLDNTAQYTLVNANVALFNPKEQIAEQYRRGQFANDSLGISEWYRDQNVPKHTTGSFTSSTPIVDNASQTGSTITSTGWASGATALKAGDVIEFAGVYAANPLSKVSTGKLMQFTLTADCADTAGAVSLLISPSLITSGPLQNVSGSPAASAAVYVWNTRSTTYAQTATVSPQSFVYHREFATVVMADLADPIAGAKASFARSKDFGINIRLVQQYLLASDQNGTRLDCIYGADAPQPRLATRVAG